MATTKQQPKYDAKNAMYAYVGAGQFLVEKAREIPAKARELPTKAWSPSGWRENAVKTYADLAHRGEKLVASIRRSAYTQRAVEQTKSARTQVKAAATSVRKAVDTGTGATKAAAKKVS
jgi:hypothetical protein